VSDRIGQKRLFLAGLVILALFAAPFFSMLETLHPATVWWVMVLGVGVVFPILYAPEPQLFAAQFPAEIRYSGISVSVQVAGVLGSGVAIDDRDHVARIRWRQAALRGGLYGRAGRDRVCVHAHDAFAPRLTRGNQPS
jgi:MFS family permease